MNVTAYFLTLNMIGKMEFHSIEGTNRSLTLNNFIVS